MRPSSARTSRSAPETSRIKARAPWELPRSCRRTSTRSFATRRPLVLPAQPHLRDFLESHFPEAMKLMEQVGDLLLTSLRRLAGPRRGWVGISQKGSPSSTTWSLQSQQPGRGPSGPWCRALPQPLPAARGSFSTTLDWSLPPGHGPRGNKAFCSKKSNNIK